MRIRGLSVVVAGLVAIAASKGLAQSTGENTFKANCQICHGAKGAGDTQMGQAMKAKSLTGPEVTKMSDTDLLATIKAGKGLMPPFKDKLSDADIKGVIAYIHVLQKTAGGAGASGPTQ